MTTPAERKARNQGAFREANERLDEGARELVGADDSELVPFLCECSQRNCVQVVLVRLSEYEQVRAGPRFGLAALGHEDLSIERVVARNDRFVTTEKFGEAGEVHGDADPRS